MIKNISTLIVCFFLIATNSSNAQSEKETIEFLNTKLFNYHKDYFMVFSTTIHPRLNKKVIQVNTVWDPNKLIQIDYLLPEHKNIVEVLRAPAGNFCLIVKSDKDSFKNQYKTEDGVGITFGGWHGEIRICLFQTNEEETIRVKKALLYLFKLNSKELNEDNLFKN